MSGIYRRFHAWSQCDECGFEGVLEFSCRDDETYDDADALGVLVDGLCPACETLGAVLVTLDHFEEMQAFERARRSGEGEER